MQACLVSIIHELGRLAYPYMYMIYNDLPSAVDERLIGPSGDHSDSAVDAI